MLPNRLLPAELDTWEHLNSRGPQKNAALRRRVLQEEMRVDPTSLRDYLAPLPEGFPVTVPKEYILELLDGSVGGAVATQAAGADMTVQEVAVRFGRDPSTVRLWINQGRFSGAYRFQGREWRIPPAALAAFEDVERQRAPGDVPQGQAANRGQRARVIGLSDWRRIS